MTIPLFLFMFTVGWFLHKVMEMLQDRGIWCRWFGHRWSTVSSLVRDCKTCNKREKWQWPGWK